MARGDPTYFRVDIDIIDGERFSQLTDRERDTFIFGPWALAVKVRSACVPGAIGNPQSLAHRLRKQVRTVKRHLAVLHKLGLIELQPDGSIYVPHVKELHPKLKWDRDGRVCPIRGKPTSPYGENDLTHMGGHREGRGERGDPEGSFISSGSYINKGTPRENPAVPGSDDRESDPEIWTPSRPPNHWDEEAIKQKAWEVQATLELADEELPAITHLICNFFSGINLALTATRERMQAVNEGTAERIENVMAYFTRIVKGEKDGKDSM